MSSPHSAPNGQQRLILGHPPGLFLLFITEMWERFSYYGMRALLVLYLTSTISISDAPPGVHINTVEFEERAALTPEDMTATAPAVSAAGVPPVEPPKRTHSFSMTVAVDAAAPPAQPMTTTGPTRLVLTFLEEGPAGADGKPTWIAAASQPSTTFTRDGERLTGKPVAVRISNPTSEPIECNVRVLGIADAPRFFTVNEKTGVTALKIKPDSARGPDEKFVEVRIGPSQYASSGRDWDKSPANRLYGWYTGLAYLLPIFGGLLADKLLGTHRSMLIGGLIIALGHVVLGISGIGELDHNEFGMSVFVFGLALIVLGTGHFKPTVSVMVGQLYSADDPRRDTAYTIFYMGINVGAFICAFVCGTLGEKYGWHYGFGAAAVGMLLGLFAYILGRPTYLAGVGLPPAGAPNVAPLFALASIVLAAAVAVAYQAGTLGLIDNWINYLFGFKVVLIGVLAVLIAAAVAFVASQAKMDRGPTACILVFIVFNTAFWIAFEQAGSSLNLFAAENTDLTVPFTSWTMPATWFQSFNPLLIILLAPVFALLWVALGKRGLNPSQPLKIAYALLLVGGGYLFMVFGAREYFTTAAKVSLIWLTMTYLLHTLGELCISPTGLAFVTRAAPRRHVSFLMGLWFLSSFIAGKLGGELAGYVEDIESGKWQLPWYDWGWRIGGQADFYMMFVLVCCAAGLVILALTPMLKKALRGRV
ncbi:MAG: peptide MFS transporter [Planctomycetia bacterium]|nr:MAG: peptide MFS transporter [Planctomycetia bacterium]